MAYPYSTPDSSPDQYPSVGHGAYFAEVTDASNHRKPLERQLIWVVLLLGLVTYLVSYGLADGLDGLGWGARFSTLAAIVAALGLLPRQSAHAKVMAALAVMGFLEALSRCIAANGQDLGWATVVIVVLTGLQAVIAIAALLVQPRVLGAADLESAPYDAYAYYARLVEQYYAGNDQQLHQQTARGQATAHAQAVAPAEARHARQSVAERDALYAEYFNAQSPGPNAPASSHHSGEATQTDHPGTGLPTTGPAQDSRPSSAPVEGSPPQSSLP